MADKPKYDVAISFLMHDMEFARSLYSRLNDNLSVFFFERRQEELTGREGLEGFREPFQQALVSVVLFRPPWGEGGWTGVERAAIGEECQKRGYRNLFMVQMKGTFKMPGWVPTTHIYFNVEQFPFDELVGSIKAKVLELGGTLEPMTAEKRVEMHILEQEFEDYRHRLWSTTDGLQLMRSLVKTTFDSVVSKCAAMTEKGILVRCGANHGRCVITSDIVSIVIYWNRSGLPNIEKDQLNVEDFEWNMALPDEPPLRYYEGVPRPCDTRTYKPALTRSRDAIWKDSEDETISALALADKIVIAFFELVERVTRERNQPTY